jgi:hypothetical protein
MYIELTDSSEEPKENPNPNPKPVGLGIDLNEIPSPPPAETLPDSKDVVRTYRTAQPRGPGRPEVGFHLGVAWADVVRRQILRQWKPRRPEDSPYSPCSGAGSATDACGRPEVSFHLGATDSPAGLNPSDQKTQTCDFLFKLSVHVLCSRLLLGVLVCLVG